MLVDVSVQLPDGQSATKAGALEAVTQVPDPPPSGSGNDYFNALVARSDFWKGYSLRPVAGAPTASPYYANQLLAPVNGGYAAANKPLWITYSPGTDTDPHAQDAAKVIIPPISPTPIAGTLVSSLSPTDTTVTISPYYVNLFVGMAIKIDSEVMAISAVAPSSSSVTVTRGAYGTAATTHAAGSAIYISANTVPNAVRLPLKTSDGHTYLATWDAYWTDSWAPSGMTSHKAFQFTVNGGDNIWFETQTRFQGQYSVGFQPGVDVASVTCRSYNSTPAGDADWSLTDGNHIGPGVTSIDPIKPLIGQFIIRPNTWTRFWARIDQRANDYEWVDYWVADENTDAVQLYSRIPLSIPPTTKLPSNTIRNFVLEFNASQDKLVRGDLRDYVIYVRNVAVLQDVGDMSGLLVRPVK